MIHVTTTCMAKMYLVISHMCIAFCSVVLVPGLARGQVEFAELAADAAHKLRVATCRHMRVDAEVECSVHMRKLVDWKASIIFHRDQDRLLLKLEGDNLMEPMTREGVALSGQKVNWLYLPGGCVERKDMLTGRTSFTQRAIKGDPKGPLWWPSSAYWMFGGGTRDGVFRMKHFQQVKVDGEYPDRVVYIEAIVDQAGSPGQNRYKAELVEQWDWSARKLTAEHRSTRLPAAKWGRTWSLTIHRVKKTQLFSIPVEWECELWGLSPEDDNASILPLSRCRVTASVPDLDPPEVDAHLDGSFGDAQGDKLLDGSSFLSHEILASRQAFLLSLMGSPATPMNGTWRWWSVHKLITASLALVFGGIVLLSKRRPWVLLSGLCVLGSITYGLWASDGSANGKFSQLATRNHIATGRPEMANRYLCGPDAMFLLLRRLGCSASYVEILRCVRPGMRGASMKQLMIAAECFARHVKVSRAENWDYPPTPCVAHVFGDHYVALSRGEGKTVSVADPVYGSFSVEWNELRKHVSMLLAAPGGLL